MINICWKYTAPTEPTKMRKGQEMTNREHKKNITRRNENYVGDRILPVLFGGYNRAIRERIVEEE